MKKKQHVFWITLMCVCISWIHMFAFASETTNQDKIISKYDEYEAEMLVPYLSAEKQMTMSENGYALIKRFEGCRLNAYKALPTEKYYTIGWGHYGADVYDGMTITQEQADAYLVQDVAAFQRAVNNFLNLNGIHIGQNQYDALVSFTYNLGNVWVSTPTFDLKTILKNGYQNYTATQIRAAFTEWNRAGGNVVPGLTRRRNAEADLFLLGIADTCDCSTSYAGTYYVTTSGYTLTIRTGHGTSYEVAGNIPDGARVSVSKGNGSWAHVSYNGINGYCSMEYLTKMQTDTEAPVISNVESEVRNLSSLGYIVHCNVSDNVGVTRIEFHVAYGDEGQWKQYSGNIGDNYAWAYIPISDFGYRLGTYWTHIYAYDADGNFDRNVSLGPVYINGAALATQEKETVKEGTYCLKNANGSWMDVNGAEDKNGAEVVIPNVFNGGGNQQFRVEYIGNGKYHLIAAFGSESRVLDINRGSNYSDPLQSGCKVDIWQQNDAEAQEFYLTPWGDGSYAIELASKDNYVIGGRHAVVGGGYYLQQAVKEAPSQHWYFCDTSGNLQDVTPGVKCTKIILNYPSMTLAKIGDTLQLTATVLPNDAANKAISWSSSNTAVATVDSNGFVTAVGAGSSTITATTQDGTHVSAACEITVCELLTVTGKASLSEVATGNSVTITAAASGGKEGYTYSFLIHNLETDKWFRVAPFGTADKYVWTASGTGEREFFAEVKDKDGAVIRSEAVKVTVKVKNSELSIIAKTNVSEVAAGSTVTISANATGGTGSYTYSFLIHNLENDTWYRWPFDKNTEHVWRANGSGKREFFAEVKDEAGTVVRSEAMKLTVKSAQTPLEITGKVSTSQVAEGNTVTLSASAIGGAGNYTYSFLIHNLENDTWYRWAFDKNAEYVWTANGSGNREFFAEVKDAAGTVVRSEAMKVTVGSGSNTDPLRILASANQTQVASGTTVTISALAAGGSGNYTYSFLVHNLANDSWYRFGDFAKESSYNWTAGSAGTREFFVEVKDSSGTVVRSSAIIVTVK